MRALTILYPSRYRDQLVGTTNPPQQLSLLQRLTNMAGSEEKRRPSKSQFDSPRGTTTQTTNANANYRYREPPGIASVNCETV